MSYPRNALPSLAYRLPAGLFGLLLGLSTLGSGFLVLFLCFTPGEGPNNEDGMLFIAVGLFSAMAIVLAGSASSMFVFAFTGRRGPLIHQGSLKVLVLVFGTAVSVVFVGSVLGRDWSGALRAVGLGVELLGIFLAGLVFDRRSESDER